MTNDSLEAIRDAHRAGEHTSNADMEFLFDMIQGLEARLVHQAETFKSMTIATANLRTENSQLMVDNAALRKIRGLALDLEYAHKRCENVNAATARLIECLQAAGYTDD